MSKPIDVNENDFDTTVLKSVKPTLVDFWAPWCAPCRVVAPVMEALAEEYDNKVEFAKVNVDTEPRLATRYGIRSIPTLLIFKDGVPVKQLIGAQPRDELKKSIDATLAPLSLLERWFL